MSPSAFSAGEESAEAGDNEPKLAVDQADLRYPSCIAIGAVADCRRGSLPFSSTMDGLGGVWVGMVVANAARSVSSFKAVDGARTWYLGSEGSVYPWSKERCEFVRADVVLDGAQDWRVASEPVAACGSSELAASRGAVEVWEDARSLEDDSGPSMVLYRSGTTSGSPVVCG